MLGVFLLGLCLRPTEGGLPRRNANLPNILAMIASAGVCLAFLILIKLETLKLGWSWLIVIGTAMTFAMGILLRWALTKRPRPQ